MQSFPLQAILFWIAVALAPQDASQILVKGPDATWAWTRQTSGGWSYCVDRSAWIVHGDTVKTLSGAPLEGGNWTSIATKYIAGVKDHDWKKSAVLKLQPNASLAKEGDAFFYTLDEGATTAKRYAIRFRRPPAVGAVLIYEIDPAAALAAMSAADRDNLRKAVDRRLNAGTEKLAQVRKLEDGRIEVALLRRNDADTQRVERLLARQGTLEFRILASNKKDKTIVEQARQDESKVDVVDRSGKRLAWWVPVKVDVGKSLNDDTDVVHRVRKQDGREVTDILVIADPQNITGDYLTQANVDADAQTGSPCINFTFNDAGGQRFLKLTGGHLPAGDFRYRLGIILDSELCLATKLNSVVYDKGRITGAFNKEEASDLADILNRGSLPCRLRLAPTK